MWAFYFLLNCLKIFEIEEIIMKKNLLALLAISAVLAAADNEKFIVELEKTTVTAQKI